jgi:hypothetical protein
MGASSATGFWGSGVKCSACRSEMRLTDVEVDTSTVRALERHSFRCSACPQTAQRLMLHRLRKPIIHLPVVITPSEPPTTKLQMGRRADPSAWANAIDKVNARHAALKEQAAKTPEWGSVVEKLSVALKEQADAMRAFKAASAVEQLRSRQVVLKERAGSVRATDDEFDRVWNGQTLGQTRTQASRTRT